MTELRADWLIGHYALGRDKFCAETNAINNFSSERVDSKGLYGRLRLRVMGLLVRKVNKQKLGHLSPRIKQRAT